MNALLEAPVAIARKTNPEKSPLDITDEELMKNIQAQDPQALGYLHDRYAGIIKGLVMKVVHNEAESEDMLQEIFVEVWNRSGSYCAEKGKPLGWLVTLARRRAIDRLRKREAYCRAGDRLAEETKHQQNNWVAHVEEDIAHGEMREHLTRVLGELPEAQRQAIELAYYKGMSQREIAAFTGIPLGTIKTRLELAMKKLTIALEGLEELI